MSTDNTQVDIIGVDALGREIFSFSLVDKRATTRFLSQRLQIENHNINKLEIDHRNSLQVGEHDSDSSDPDLNLENMIQSTTSLFEAQAQNDSNKNKSFL